MYYLYKVEDTIRVPPNRVGKDLKQAVLDIAREEYERRVLKDIGFVLGVFSPEILGDGKVIHNDPGVYYSVRFDLLAYKPEVNEVVYGVIKDVVEFGAFTIIGPFEALLHISQIGAEKYTYNKKEGILVSSGKKNTIKPGDKLIGKISTASMKAVSDVKIGITLRANGLGMIR
ncbi:MAG: DNA-directed RNA polymerase [Candidatus Anstonellales archaeon]